MAVVPPRPIVALTPLLLAFASPAASHAHAFAPDCDVVPAILEYVPMKPGVPLDFSMTFVLRPDCGEEDGDPRTARIAWGDGAISTLTPVAGSPRDGLATIVVSARHTYRDLPVRYDGTRGWGVDVSVFNQRSGHVLRREVVAGRTLGPPRPPRSDRRRRS